MSSARAAIMCWSAPAGPAVGLTARNSVLFVRGAEKSEIEAKGRSLLGAPASVPASLKNETRRQGCRRSRADTASDNALERWTQS